MDDFLQDLAADAEIDAEQQSEIDAAHDEANRLLAEEAVDRMNAKHGVASDHGKAIIISETHDPILNRFVLERSAFSDIRLLYAPDFVRVKAPAGRTTLKNVADLWVHHPRRRNYSAIVFDPGVEHPNGIYNLWRGFPVAPKKGSWSALQQHIHQVIAGGNDRIANYIFGWMSRAVQKPGEPGEVAIVMRGSQGAGKGIFARAFGHLWGQHFVHVARTHHLTGHFNGHLQDAVVVFADEATWGGDKAAEGALKALITEPTLQIERKGRDAVMVKNVIHLLIASNNDWIVPAGMDDRRFCVVDVIDTHANDGAYFGRILHELEHGGYEAMLYDLQHFDLSHFDHRDLPRTAAGLRQKLLGMSPLQKFWIDALNAGEIEPGQGWPIEISKKAFHDRYLAVMDQVCVRGPKSTEAELGYAIKELIPGWKRKDAKTTIVRRVPVTETDPITGYVRQTDKTKREARWVLPSLEACRKHFETMLKQPVDWAAMELGS